MTSLIFSHVAKLTSRLCFTATQRWNRHSVQVFIQELINQWGPELSCDDLMMSQKQWVTWLRQNICEAELRVGFEEHLLLRSPQAQSCSIFVPVLWLLLTELVSQRCISICNSESKGQRSKSDDSGWTDTRHSSNVSCCSDFGFGKVILAGTTATPQLPGICTYGTNVKILSDQWNAWIQTGPRFYTIGGEIL